jgi:3' exoribonuclease, RNase T-like
MTPGTPFPTITLRYDTLSEAEAAADALTVAQRALGSHADVLVHKPVTVHNNGRSVAGDVVHGVTTSFGVRAPVGGAPIMLMVEKAEFPVVLRLDEMLRTGDMLRTGAAHVMVDLETLGRRAGCQVLSLGAVFFGPEGLGDEFYRNFKLEEQADAGLRRLTGPPLDGVLVGHEARAALEVDRMHPTRALIDFGDWLKARSPEPRFWGNGASFDEPILIAAYEALKVRVPWKYKNSRCFRTLKELHKNVPWGGDRGVAHHALDDAKSQALHAVKILNSIPNGWATV